MSKPYITCPYCGNNLDPGERCDCRDEIVKERSPDTAKKAYQPSTANPREPVLIPAV